MMSRAHGDALPVQRFSNFLGAAAVEHKGYDARPFARRADEAQSGNRPSPPPSPRSGRVRSGRSPPCRWRPNSRLPRRVRPHRRCCRCQPRTDRARLVHRPLKRDVGDHVAAALPRRHRLKDRLLAVNRPDASRGEHLVPGKHEEVGSRASGRRSACARPIAPHRPA